MRFFDLSFKVITYEIFTQIQKIKVNNKFTSFLSERSTEYLLIPKIVNILKKEYKTVIPIYPWLTREGSKISKIIHKDDKFLVLGLYPRRPKIDVDNNIIYVKINDELRNWGDQMPCAKYLSLYEDFIIRPKKESNNTKITPDRDYYEFHDDFPGLHLSDKGSVILSNHIANIISAYRSGRLQFDSEYQ